MNIDGLKPLVEATRGPLVECVHLGVVTVVDSSGKLVVSYGSPDLVCFLRSSSKPIQALPLIEMGGVEVFNLTDQEVAILCASHWGTDAHVAVLRSLQAKGGIQESDLLCGVEMPGDKKTARDMLHRGEAASSNRHGCSGKHSGMLLQATLRQLPLADYVNPAHPVQQKILSVFVEMCGMAAGEVILGTDGCSAPVFAVPLRRAAHAFARLCDPYHLAADRAKACRIITNAMTRYPDMIANQGDFDTYLMQVGAGKIICKSGAEGYQAVGLLPGALGNDSPGMGITMKIVDGDAQGRARPLVVIEILKRLGALSDSQLDALKGYYSRPITNVRKMEVGQIRPCF
jgi:L-asparaginase II